VLLLSGLPGSGNEVFARQIAYTIAKQFKVTYFTVNTRFDSVKEDMSAYGWNATPLEETGNWRFKNLAFSNSAVNEIIEEMKLQRSVVIDSVSELLMTHKIEEIVSLITSMSGQNKDCEQCQLLLLTEGMQDQKTEITIQHFVEGVITFNITSATDSTARHIIIRKMRGTLIPTRRLPYTIGKKGFLIETATRIT
jgi:KaiC/GvpD/RAD55 family RecA-like ATPase